MMETYIFVTKISKEQFDKTNLILSQIFPSLLIYARSLIDFGLHKLALSYLDFITDHRNSFFNLSKNKVFINEIMSLQELAKKCVAVQDEQKRSGNRINYNDGTEKKKRAN